VRVIRSLADEGRTMIMVTHDLGLAAAISDHVVFLHNGLIEEEGPPDAIFGTPKSQRLQQFITAVGPA
jgi:polar amino acid transport system ATP-binding protein